MGAPRRTRPARTDEHQAMEARLSSCDFKSGSSTAAAAARKASRAAWVRGEGDAASGGTGSIVATFTVIPPVTRPAADAASRMTSAYRRSLAFHTGESTRKTSLPSRMFPNLTWDASGSGRDWRSRLSSARSNAARSITLPRSPEEAAVSGALKVDWVGDCLGKRARVGCCR